MSKKCKLLSLVAIVALMAVPAMATPVTTASSQAPVTLTIEEYCEISYTGTSFDITLSGGATTGSDSENYTAGANFNAQITGTLVKPTSSAGTWSYTIDGAASVDFGPGTKSGTVMVTVAGVKLSDGNGNWTGGTMTITVAKK